ncbi:MAG: hypothetical protein HYV68_03560 [Candidatus Taylorbacteria bacterium]|nr:hypothetical protein [Candidatus Taylorbacteria bacterium]
MEQNKFEQTSASEIPESTVDQIINGKARVKFISDNVETRNGRVGHAYCYEIELTDRYSVDKKRATELLVWYPSVDHESDKYRVMKPEMEIDINTSQGWMRLTNSKEKREKIFQAIMSQTANMAPSEKKDESKPTNI